MNQIQVSAKLDRLWVKRTSLQFLCSQKVMGDIYDELIQTTLITIFANIIKNLNCNKGEKWGKKFNFMHKCT